MKDHTRRTFVRTQVPDVAPKNLNSLKESDTSVTVVCYCGYAKEGEQVDFINIELFAAIEKYLWWLLHKDDRSSGMILTYYATANKLFKAISGHLPPNIRDRTKISTIDSAKGLEANHVCLVFVPSHIEKGEYDLGGFQKDPNRLYQAAMRPTDSHFAIMHEADWP